MHKIWQYAATISFSITFAALVVVAITDPVMHVILGGDFMIVFAGICTVVSVYGEIGLDILKRIGYDGNMNRTKTNTIQITQITKTEDIKCHQKTTQKTINGINLIGQPLN